VGIFKTLHCDQRSDEWFKARLGKITASNFDKVLTKTGKPSSQAGDLVNKAVAEKLLGYPEETFESAAMIRGRELEPAALQAAVFLTDIDFKEVGFLDSDLGYGCSPDGIAEETGIEIKCPLAHTHVSYLAEGTLPAKYLLQVQGSMLVTGFKEWHFFSYHPELPSFHLVIQRDEQLIEKLKDALLKSAKEVDEKYNYIAAHYQI